MTLGNTGKKFESDSSISVNINYVGAQTNTVLITGVSGFEIEIHNIFISSSANTGVTELNEETSDALIWKIYHRASDASYSGLLHKDIVANKDLLITCVANVFISVTYHLKPV